MKISSFWWLSLWSLPVWTADAQEAVVRLPAVWVTGVVAQVAMPLSAVSNQVAGAAATARDAAELLREVPGAAVVRNGPLTGLAQLRGLTGERVRLVVDGIEPTPACPNHMDPPLHYVAPSQLATLWVAAGVTPVSLGGDSIAGTIVAEAAPPRFAGGDRPEVFGEVGGAFRTGNDGRVAHGQAGVATRWGSARYDGAFQDGEDYRTRRGDVAATEFRVTQQALTLAARTPAGVWSVDGALTRSRDAGTPALPMDLIEDDGYRLGARYQGEHDFGVLQGRVYFHTIEHLMDNFSLRPSGPMRMESPASSEDVGVSAGVTLPRQWQTWRAGLEGRLSALDARQHNVVSDLWQTTFHEARRERLGGYVEWQSDGSEQWRTQLGVRSDVVWSDAGRVRKFFPATAADAAAFNARDRSRTEVNLDGMAAVQYRPVSWCALEVAGARKNRAPSVLERYLWTPLSASAGQADGRTYWGNLDLESETAYQLAGTVALQRDGWEAKLTPFYTWVEDFIQGVPATRLDGAGRPVLQYQNVDRVELYGAEGAARYWFTSWLGVAGTMSYVRGVNRSGNDNLYRVAPWQGSARVEHRWRGWESQVECVAAARQRHVAKYNAEPITAGWAVLNLRTSYRWWERLTTELAVENVFDKRYSDHLGGVNRVAGSVVGVGERLPAPGRSVTLAARYEF